MELRHLTTFRMVAQLQSFRHAAEALGYVQANVTAHIQILEDELGVRLFDRLGRHIALTDAGRQLLDYAERLLRIAQEARGAFSNLDAVKGTITIGATETLCVYRLPALLQLFRERFPQVQVLFRPYIYVDLRRAVSEGVVDLALLIARPLHANGLIAEPLIQEPIALLVAPTHPLAQRTQVHPADLEAETLLLTEPGCSYRTALEHQLANVGVAPKATLEFSSVEAVKQCAILGLGVAALPAISVAAAVTQDQLVALPWVHGDFELVTQMLWPKAKWVSPAMQAFFATAREVIQGEESSHHP